jgi:TRAP-type uncharacterized transport system fused permease subunit
MFVFYYSVLSEVTPPTALAAVGAAAITGGRTVATMWQALKYALPAFLVPVAFVLTGPGEYLLARGPWLGIVWTTVAACAAVAALAVATGGWLLGVGRATALPRVLAALAGLLLLYLHPVTISIAAVLLLITAALVWWHRRTATGAPDTAPAARLPVGRRRQSKAPAAETSAPSSPEKEST